MNLIITADDFGRSHEINTAVLCAHREGILTGASLMVSGEAADEAVAIARETPTLAVGLHVVAVDGRASLPAERIPHLVGMDGRFPVSAVRTGLRYALSRSARCELAMELAEQFRLFAQTGLPLSHVDGHQHMHVHPAVAPIVVPLAIQYGARGFRLPRDDLRLALRHDHSALAGKLVTAAALRFFSWRCERTLARNRLPYENLLVPSRCYGLLQSGKMDEAYVLSVLRQMAEPCAEMYFHPTTGERTDPLGPNPQDLETLLSPAVRRAIEERGFRLMNYCQTARG